MLQLLYVSSATPNVQIDMDDLLRVAQANNARDEITGLLYTDGPRFLQVLEGPKETVENAFLRIINDHRHRALVLLSRRLTTKREFGGWSMARRLLGETDDVFLTKIGELCRNADPNVAGTFVGLVDIRQAA